MVAHVPIDEIEAIETPNVYMSRNVNPREAMDRCLVPSRDHRIVLSVTDSIDVQIIVTATCEQRYQDRNIM